MVSMGRDIGFWVDAGDVVVKRASITGPVKKGVAGKQIKFCAKKNPIIFALGFR